MIDLRSDVLTKAPQQMLKAMSQTKYESNDWLEDLAGLKCEKRLAQFFGKQAAMLFPTASMANIASVLGQTSQGSEIIISGCAHATERESASLAIMAGVTTRQIMTKNGLFTVEEVAKRIRKKQSWMTFPNTDVIFIENGTFQGRVWDLATLREMKKLATDKSVKLHIDGARIFNALASYKLKGPQIADCYDSMTVCLSKGLCCPMGAAVVGTSQLIHKLKWIRKSIGGGIWQYGIVAAAVEYGLDHLLPVIQKDNEMAQILAKGLSKVEGIVVKPEQNEINMVHWSVSDKNFDHSALFEYLKANNIKIKPYSQDGGFYRFVVYAQIREREIEQTIAVIKEYFSSLKK